MEIDNGVFCYSRYVRRAAESGMFAHSDLHMLRAKQFHETFDCVHNLFN